MIKKHAFSLIELLTVVAIISILATLGVSSYSAAVKKGRDAKQKSDIHNLQQALILYRADNGKYPGSLLQLKPDYIKNIPVNTVTNDNYSYIPTNSNKQFTICTGILESPKGSANSSAQNSLATCTNTTGDGPCQFYCASNP